MTEVVFLAQLSL